MVKELGFEQIAIPLVADCEECPRSSIFATKGCLSADNLLIIFPSASTLPGIWSRSLCIEKGLQAGMFLHFSHFIGTMLPFFVKALSLGLGVIVLNPNVNSVRIATPNGGFTKHSIPHNETPDLHVLFFFSASPSPVDTFGTASSRTRLPRTSSFWRTARAACRRRTSSNRANRRSCAVCARSPSRSPPTLCSPS